MTLLISFKYIITNGFTNKFS